MAYAIGTTDEVNTCDCCGKTDLMLTVIIRLDNGEIVNYGTTCAGNNTGKAKRQILTEIADHAADMLRQAQAEFATTPEAAAERAAFDSRPRELVGPAAAEWVRAACDAADEARKRIALKFGIAERWRALYR